MSSDIIRRCGIHSHRPRCYHRILSSMLILLLFYEPQIRVFARAWHFEFQFWSLSQATECPEWVKSVCVNPFDAVLILHSCQIGNRKWPRVFSPLLYCYARARLRSQPVHLMPYNSPCGFSGWRKWVCLIKINSRLWNNSCPHYSEGCQSKSDRSEGAECRTGRCAVTQDWLSKVKREKKKRRFHGNFLLTKHFGNVEMCGLSVSVSFMDMC